MEDKANTIMETRTGRDTNNNIDMWINDNIRQAVENLLKQYEENYNINIFFACDTGSRALGVAVESSDFDLNGFIIPHYNEYIRIIRKSPVIIAKQAEKIVVGDQTYEIDIQLWDIKDWLREKVEKNTLGCDFWFDSPIIYRNNHIEITEEIRKNIKPPFYYFWGKFRNNINLCEKALKKEGCQNKRLMNTLIYAFQYLHTRLFDTFPSYNIFNEVKHILDNKDSLLEKNLLSEDEFSNIIQCVEFINICYEEKKKGRKSLTNEIPKYVKSFISMLDNKFNAKTKKDGLVNEFNVDIAQDIFNKILTIYKK